MICLRNEDREERIALLPVFLFQASAVTPSAQVSMRVRIESSSYEEMVTCVLEKLTM
jgi:hypothetical protein